MLYENYPACVDCKHVIKNGYDVYECALKPCAKSIVTGDIQYLSCYSQRKSYGDCGKEGKLFEPRKKWLRDLVIAMFK